MTKFVRFMGSNNNRPVWVNAEAVTYVVAILHHPDVWASDENTEINFHHAPQGVVQVQGDLDTTMATLRRDGVF